MTEAINTVAVAYGVCAEARPPITSFRDCGTSRPPRRSTRGVALLDAEVHSGALTSPSVSVVQVLPDSVAAGAQLLPGDIIVSLDGRTIGNSRELRNAVDAVQLGSSVALAVLRNGQRESLNAQF